MNPELAGPPIPQCSALPAAGRRCVHPVGHLTEASPRLHWDGLDSYTAGPSYWGQLPPGRQYVRALGYAEAVSSGAVYRVLSWLPGTARSVRHADSCDHTRVPCAGGPECVVGPGVPEAVLVEDDAGEVHVLGRDCGAHEAVPFVPAWGPTSSSGGPEVNLLDEGARFTPTSVVVEPPAGRLFPDGVVVCDPQHGAHAAPDLDKPEPDDAACSWAWRLEPSKRAALGPIYLRADAGLDDFVAAAAFYRPSFPSRETFARVRAVARADNAVVAAEVGEWAPGQDHQQATDAFPGLAALCACRALPLSRRVELVWQWCLTGRLTLTPGEMAPLGLPPLPDGVATDYLAELTTVARRVLAEGRAAAKIQVWWRRADGEEFRVPSHESRPEYLPVGDFDDRQVPMVAAVTGVGKGAFAVGYAEAPVVVAISPPDARGARLVTVGRATNARLVELDFHDIVKTLSNLEAAAEPLVETARRMLSPGTGQWGGNAKTLVFGSPKPGGTYLDPELIVRTVLAHVRWVTP